MAEQPDGKDKGLAYQQADESGGQNLCEKLHEWANSRHIFSFPFDEKDIPRNGLYLLFEKGESAHGGNRIVRIGTHNGKDQLRSRLKQHFLNENKDRSIFRKNVGRCLLSKAADPFLKQWELDLTTRKAKELHAAEVDVERQRAVEQEVTSYIQASFSFTVVQIDEKANRLELESKIISTVSLCTECRPSPSWLGLYSPKQKIRESGLWLVNELYRTPLSDDEFHSLELQTGVSGISSTG